MTDTHNDGKGKREGVPANPLIVALDLGGATAGAEKVGKTIFA